MKIVFLAPFGIRPKGTLIARMLPLAVELERSGHEVVIIAPPYTNPEDSGRVETVMGIRLVNIRLSYPGGMGAPIMAWRMYRAAMNERPDLVHLFKPKGYGGLAVMLMQLIAASGRTTPHLFVDCDDLEGKGGMNDLKGYRTLERLLFDVQERFIPRHVQGVTVASRMLQAEMGHKGVETKCCHYLPNGIFRGQSSGDGTAVRRRLGIADDAPVLLLYTRFFEFDQERLYSILENLNREVPDCRILVVGKGPNAEEDALVQVACERGFSDSLIMAGWIEPGDIPDYIAAGDVALYLLDDTLINRAKCPAKLTELLAAGIPVVADRIGQAAEYMADEAATRFSTDTELVERLAALLNDPSLRRSVGQAAQEYVQQHFEWAILVRKLAEFYRQTIPRS
ncbi:MAG TPA: glycosyltransferase family 4 protein [Desulfuromonadaceae bacterium]|jgi:glycosyltransferase involved in cell wall biosynthesis